MRVRLISIFFCLLLVVGCSKGNLQTGTIGGTTGGILYVSTSAAIQHFNSAFSINGNVAPSATISGAATLLSSPSRLLLDATSNRLFVSSSGSSSILIFENVSTTSGNASPTRTISGASTLLTTPTDLALDTVNNALYVADGTRILLFLSASTVTGNVPPVHNINMGFSIGSIQFMGRIRFSEVEPPRKLRKLRDCGVTLTDHKVAISWTKVELCLSIWWDARKVPIKCL